MLPWIAAMVLAAGTLIFQLRRPRAPQQDDVGGATSVAAAPPSVAAASPSSAGSSGSSGASVITANLGNVPSSSASASTGDPAPPVRTVILAVTDPSDATISAKVADGPLVKLGASPQSLSIKSGDAAVVTISAPGYVTKSFNVEPGTDRYQSRLQPISNGAGRPPTTAKPPVDNGARPASPNPPVTQRKCPTGKHWNANVQDCWDD